MHAAGERMCWILLLSCVLAATCAAQTTNDPVKTTFGRFGGNANNGPKYGAKSFPAPPGTRFCSINVQRDPPTTSNEDPRDAILHIVNAEEDLIELEWSTTAIYGSPGAIFANVDVRWIDKNASASEVGAAKCQPLPRWERALHSVPPPEYEDWREIPKPSTVPVVLLDWTPLFNENRGWDEGSAERKLQLTAPEGYELCRQVVDEQVRDPQSQPVRYSAAGYQVIEASETKIVWQAWVEGDGHFWGPGHSLRVKFGALWIRNSASQDLRDDNLCMPLPKTFPVHVVRVPNDRGPKVYPDRNGPSSGQTPIRTPVAQYEVVDVIYCRDKTTKKDLGLSFVRSVSSPKSCIDARKALDELENSADLCEWNFNEHRPWAEVKRIERRWTASCTGG